MKTCVQQQGNRFRAKWYEEQPNRGGFPVRPKRLSKTFSTRAEAEAHCLVKAKLREAIREGHVTLQELEQAAHHNAPIEGAIRQYREQQLEVVGWSSRHHDDAVRTLNMVMAGCNVRRVGDLTIHRFDSFMAGKRRIWSVALEMRADSTSSLQSSWLSMRLGGREASEVASSRGGHRGDRYEYPGCRTSDIES